MPAQLGASGDVPSSCALPPLLYERNATEYGANLSEAAEETCQVLPLKSKCCSRPSSRQRAESPQRTWADYKQARLDDSRLGSVSVTLARRGTALLGAMRTEHAAEVHALRQFLSIAWAILARHAIASARVSAVCQKEPLRRAHCWV